MAQGPTRLDRAIRLSRSGQFAQAEVALRQVLASQPSDAMVMAELALAMHRQGKGEPAVRLAREVLARSPRRIEPLKVIATIFGDRELYADAIAAYELGAAIEPDRPSWRSDIGVMHMRSGDAENACVHLARAYEIAPNSVTVASNYGWALSECWRLDDAMRILRDSIRPVPEALYSLLQLAFLINYDERATRQEAFERHRALGELVELSMAAENRARPIAPVVPPTPADADRVLRVGLLTGDLREHSVSRFVEPIVANRDQARVEYVAYSTSGVRDHVSARLRPHFAQWYEIHLMQDAPATALIRQDKCDILLDLSGMTRGARWPIVARRAAPLQINYLGYPNTSGMRSVEHRIVSSITDPPGDEAFATERLTRLDPCFLCYQPPPEMRGVPCDRVREGDGDAVVFCSFNHMNKLGPRTIDAWAAILRAVPGSRLVVKNLGLRRPSVARRFVDAFAERGVERERIATNAFVMDTGAHWDHYRRCDIGLDPVVYHGTTTTCEALFMGVPVVTMVGDRHASRVGPMLLTTLGAPELIARDEGEYVRLAAELARDRARVASYRATLRDRLLASPLCDGPRFARAFEGTLRELWRARCGV